mmetsp:Transcript_6700/g.5830  ORF Transcript_6700/g.5830 Transcript_6700/m.5830 type:complete len:80 (-) Transcript_6700:162-401(-)
MWFFFKLMMIVLVLSGFIITMFFQNYFNCRRSRSHKKSVKDKIMGRDSLNMSFSKIDPEEFCIICMEVYKPSDKVVRLP